MAIDPEVVERLRRLLGHWEAAAFKSLDTQQDIWDLSALLADWERRGEELLWMAEEYADMGAGAVARDALEGKP